MSAVGKVKNKADELIGKAKEMIGRATYDEDVKNAGRSSRSTANLREAGEKVKDAFQE